MNERGGDLAARLAGLAGLVEARADWSHQQGRQHPSVLAACAEAGLFKLWVPLAYGGSETELPESLALFEEASRLDGSFGFTLTIGVGGGLFGAFLPPPTARRVFEPANAVIAGSGHVGGTAEVVEGGYVASGRWDWASGAHHATTFTANCAVTRDGRALTGPGGQPVVRAMAFSPSDVEILATWEWPGLRGTDSNDIVVTRAVVPAAATFSLGEPVLDGPLYRYPFQSIAEVSFAAVALGIGRRGLDEFASLARTKPDRAGGRLADAVEVQDALGEAEAAMRSARAYFFDSVHESWATITSGQPLSPTTVALVRLAAAHATSAAARAVDRCHELAGMSPLGRGSRLGRAWLDVHAVTQHMAVSRRNVSSAGRDLLGAQ
jgi:indole-3-acetate monooxygenase